MNILKRSICTIACAISLVPTTNIYAASSQPALPGFEVKIVIDLAYPIGSIFVDSSETTIPPGEGVEGVHWVEDTTAQGSVIVGYSTDTNWTVAPGSAAGDSQSAAPYQLTAAELATHSHTQGEVFERNYRYGISDKVIPASEIYRSGKEGGHRNFPLTSAEGGNEAHMHALKGIKRYGVKIWKRVS